MNISAIDDGNVDAPPGSDTNPDADVVPQASSAISPSEIETPTRPDLSVVRLIQKADHSAGRLVNLLAKHFPSFRDEARFDGRRVRFLKRAQIFVGDIWAALNGADYGAFDDIWHLTMFAGEQKWPEHSVSDHAKILVIL
jgi:hypothetical protein